MLLALRERLEQRVAWEILETPEHRDLRVRMAYRESRDGQASREQWVELELLAHKVLPVCLARRVLLEPQDVLEIVVRLVLMELVVRQDSLEWLEARACLAAKVRREHLVPLDFKVALDLLVLLGRVDYRAQPDWPEVKEIRELLVVSVPPDSVELLEIQESVEIRAWPVKRETLDPRVQRDLRAPPGLLDLPERWAFRAEWGHPVRPDRLVLRESRVRLDCLGQRALLVRVGSLAVREPLVRMDRQVRSVRRVNPAQLVRRVILGLQVARALLVPPAPEE